MCVLGTCVMTCHSQCVRDTRPVYVCSRNMCDDMSQSVCKRYKACVCVF